MIYECITEKREKQTLSIHHRIRESWRISTAQDPRAAGPACPKSSPLGIENVQELVLAMLFFEARTQPHVLQLNVFHLTSECPRARTQPPVL